MASLWNGIHIIARVYDPSLDDGKDPLGCFFYSLFKLLPDPLWRENSLRFFYNNQLDGYKTSGKRAFFWTFLLHDYINEINGAKKISFSDAFKMYDTDLIDKTTWGNATWNLLHSLTVRLPQTLSDKEKVYYTSLITCLMYLIPCPECRKHLKEHLSKFPLDTYLEGRDTLFMWTVELHNKVNKSLGKREIDIKEARIIHSF